MGNINNGDKISSKIFDIGSSESTLRVFPNGNTVEEEGRLKNEHQGRFEDNFPFSAAKLDAVVLAAFFNGCT